MMNLTLGPLVREFLLLFFDNYVGRVDESIGCVEHSVGRVCGVGSGVLSDIY